MRSFFCVFVTVACVGGLAVGAAGAPPGFEGFPFRIPPEGLVEGTAPEALARPAAPAGAEGFVAVRGDRFVLAESGRPVRFWATNLCFGGCFPPHEVAERMARRMATLGINCVRFHHMDASTYPRGIWRGNGWGDFPHEELDPEALDRLDYLIAQLKEQGIYANLNLHVSRTYGAADGFPEVGEGESVPSYGKGVDHFYPKCIEEQKRYARMLLRHVNPYTGNAYAEEPAVAMVEISNEDGLLHEWRGGGLDRLPEPYRRELARQWNEWLAERYGSTEGLRRAWSEGAVEGDEHDLLSRPEVTDFLQVTGEASATSERIEGAAGEEILKIIVHRPGAEGWHVQHIWQPVRLEKDVAYTLRMRMRASREAQVSVACRMAYGPWGSLGLSQGVEVGPQWRDYEFSFVATETDANARVDVSGLSQEDLTLWLTGIELVTASVVGLPEGQSLGHGSVSWASRQELAGRTAAVQRDVVLFLRETEVGYWSEMRRYLQEELGVRMPVTGTAVGFTTPQIAAETADFVDSHAYWQHPGFPGRPWDAENWVVGQRAMVNEPRRSTISSLAARRVFGLPYTVTEYNHAAPNRYEAEGFPLIAVYGSFQAWDGIFEFAYSHGSNWETDHFHGFFDVAGHMLKLAQFPACADLFLNRRVPPPPRLAAVRLPLEQRLAMISVDFRGINALQGAADPLIWQKALLGVSVGEGRPEPPPEPAGQMSWALEDGRGLLRYVGEGCAGLIGFAAGETVGGGGITLVPGATSLDGFSAVMLNSVEGQALGEPGRYLVTATARCANEGMVWKPDGRSVGRQWGHAPTLCEGVPLTLALEGARAARLYALGPDGTRRREVAARLEGGRRLFEAGPRWQTLWYELVIE